MPLPTDEQMEKARLQVEQARARLQALQARRSDAARRLDTRRKIVLGGLLLDAAGKDEKFARVVQVLLDRVDRDQDRKAFDGWEPPVPPAGTAPGADGAAAPILPAAGADPAGP